MHGHLVPVSAKTAWIVLEARLEDGISGFGEATLFGSEKAVLEEIRLLDRRLSERPAEAVGEALALLRQAQESSARTAVRHAFEQALFDAVARRAGMSLATLLGGPHRQSVPAYANINRGIEDRSPEGFAARARSLAGSSGYRAFKIAPFDGYHWRRGFGREQRKLFETGLARIDAVRRAVGADADLLVDCHGRFNAASAADLIAQCAGFGLFWIEDPVEDGLLAAQECRSLRSAAHSRGIAIAGGERISDLSQAQRFLERGGCDVLLPDLRHTGLLEGLAILRLALANGLAASLHNPVGPVLDAVSLLAAASLDSFLVLERPVGESPLFDRIRGGPAQVKDGAVRLAAGPGLGFVPDRQVLANAAAHDFQPAASFTGMAGAGPDS